MEQGPTGALATAAKTGATPLIVALVDNEALREQANSDLGDQFVDSPKLRMAVLEATVPSGDLYPPFNEYMVESGIAHEKVIASIGDLLSTVVEERRRVETPDPRATGGGNC